MSSESPTWCPQDTGGWLGTQLAWAVAPSAGVGERGDGIRGSGPEKLVRRRELGKGGEGGEGSLSPGPGRGVARGSSVGPEAEADAEMKSRAVDGGCGRNRQEPPTSRRLPTVLIC